MVDMWAGVLDPREVPIMVAGMIPQGPPVAGGRSSVIHTSNNRRTRHLRQRGVTCDPPGNKGTESGSGFTGTRKHGAGG